MDSLHHSPSAFAHTSPATPAVKGPTAADAGGEDRKRSSTEWAATLASIAGAVNVLHSQASRREYSRCTLPRGTTPEAIVRPADAGQVVEITRAAKEFHRPLHTISRGKNWGYGDACAPQDGFTIVDLSRMNSIIEINEDLAYAVIEPGVTQGQLAGALESSGSRLMLDVTGAGPDASVIGNILQRGFGHTPYGDRSAHTCNFQYVAADSRIRHTGFGEITNSNIGHVYPYGRGPNEQGMLQQSSLGIVTRATIWLQPRPEQIVAFGFKVDDDATFAKVFEQAGRLRQSGTINSVIHFANDLRAISSQPELTAWKPAGSHFTESERNDLRKRARIAKWNAVGGLYGTREEVAAKTKVIKRTFKGVSRPRFLSRRQLTALRRMGAVAKGSFGIQKLDLFTRAVSDVFDLLNGRPTPNHLEGAFFRNRPASGKVQDAGLIWIAPSIPTTASDALRLIAIAEPIANDFGFDLPVTISPVTERASIAIMNLSFSLATSNRRISAQDCANQISNAVEQAGYPKYRQASVK